MNDPVAHDARLDDLVADLEDAPSQEAPGGFWLRLLQSLRFSIKPGTSWRKPVSEVTIKGGVEF